MRLLLDMRLQVLLLAVALTTMSCAHLRESFRDIESRYGSGTVSDAVSGSRDMDKAGTLAPWYTRIRTMHDDRKITAAERDQRKAELSRAYDDWKGGRITHNAFLAKCRTLSESR